MLFKVGMAKVQTEREHKRLSTTPPQKKSGLIIVFPKDQTVEREKTPVSLPFF